MIDSGDAKHLAAIHARSEIVSDLRCLGPVWHEVRGCDSMGVDGSVSVWSVGSDDVVVEIPNLVFVAEVVADIFQRPVLHYANGFFDFVDRSPSILGKSAVIVGGHSKPVALRRKVPVVASESNLRQYTNRPTLKYRSRIKFADSFTNYLL